MQGKSALPRNTGSPCSHKQTYEASRFFGNFAFGQLFIDCMNNEDNEDSCTFCRISWKECILWINIIFGRPSDLARRDLTHFGGSREHTSTAGIACGISGRRMLCLKNMFSGKDWLGHIQSSQKTKFILQPCFPCFRCFN